jgi:hypothetical protein
MSMATALHLSLNNLMTKKARTFMVSFAGSIGIIGIALILSVSTGVNNYINSVQRDTLASYPIQLMAETTDLSALIGSMMQTDVGEEEERPLDKVYESTIVVELMNSLNSAEKNTNDLKSFKKYLESTEEFEQYLTAIQYTYNFDWSVLTKDTDGAVLKSDAMELINAIYGGAMNNSTAGSMMGSMGGSSMMGAFDVWEEMLPGTEEGELINDLIKEEYDLIHGKWPTAYNEVVLVVNKRNEISDLALYALGLRTAAELMRIIGKDAYAKEYDDRADAICDNVVKYCFNADRGILREGPGFEQYTQHAQALAALSGALKGVEAKGAMRHAMLDEDILACTFPWQYTLFRALEKAGLYEMTAPVWEQYFSMLDRHLTTVPERPGDTRSDCHAWSALPLYEYPRGE